MGATRRSERLADRVVLLGTIGIGAEGIPRSAAPTLGGGENFRMALPEPKVQSRLQTPLHNHQPPPPPAVKSPDVWGFTVAALDRNGHRWFSSEVLKQPRRRTGPIADNLSMA